MAASAAKQQPIIEKNEWWGPCPDPKSACSQKTSVFESGAVVLEGKENKTWQLGPKETQKIVKLIQLSEIMDKDCPGNPNSIADYGASYKFNWGGRTRTVQLPGCEDEMRVLDSILKPADDQAPAKTAASADLTN